MKQWYTRNVDLKSALRVSITLTVLLFAYCIAHGVNVAGWSSW